MSETPLEKQKQDNFEHTIIQYTCIIVYTGTYLDFKIFQARQTMRLCLVDWLFVKVCQGVVGLIVFYQARGCNLSTTLVQLPTTFSQQEHKKGRGRQSSTEARNAFGSSTHSNGVHQPMSQEQCCQKTDIWCD